MVILASFFFSFCSLGYRLRRSAEDETVERDERNTVQPREIKNLSTDKRDTSVDTRIQDYVFLILVSQKNKYPRAQAEK